MKKIVLALCLIIVSSTSFAKDIQVKVSNLPKGIITFVTKYFPSTKITKASQEADDKDYNIKLSNGAELEFGKNMDWTEIISKTTIPAGIIPHGVTDYVQHKYPGKYIKYIERSKQGYDIKLNNNKKFQLDNNFSSTSFKENND